MAGDIWISKDTRWKFWRGEPEATPGSGRFDPKSQPDGVEELNSFHENCIDCELQEFQKAIIDLSKPVVLNQHGQFVIYVQPFQKNRNQLKDAVIETLTQLPLRGKEFEAVRKALAELKKAPAEE